MLASQEQAPTTASSILADTEVVVAAAVTLDDDLDCHDAFPTKAFEHFRQRGLLAAPLPVERGGADLCEVSETEALRDVLYLVGRGSLVLGRLYEGHVNALALALRYGDAETRKQVSADATAGHLFGVWNTEPAQGGLSMTRHGGALVLAGSKCFASGAGHVTRPLVTARIDDGRRLMLIVPLESGLRAETESWRPQGMRATATGTVDFSGLQLDVGAVVGEPDDYLRQPFFSCGAWRFLAVQCGGIAAVFEALRDHLVKTDRGGDPHQRARLGEAATGVETARLFVARAAEAAAAAEADPEAAIAYVNLARGAVERSGLDVIELAQRSVGLSGFLETHPLERRVRDLATYLRQPAPDHALASAAGYVLDAPCAFHALWQRL
ncbi:acyl-CoA/acyl-ACP dehydrogenase [Methylobacterium sp. C25]|uniref:acyl-CoA dehydrogenase family protein n=1 Tax=Methylobacterium sp. C25 TaxID=2721622 RepID=UPI001F2523E7|nr:acyl-CoA dehydrogenase family protein [Methylobacterium sp. C25]MCE4226205.1 acyl-CoA/acyl-ACP dehydrogenase [Methylobacterium sp. C25]